MGVLSFDDPVVMAQDCKLIDQVTKLKKLARAATNYSARELDVAFIQELVESASAIFNMLDCYREGDVEPLETAMMIEEQLDPHREGIVANSVTSGWRVTSRWAIH